MTKNQTQTPPSPVEIEMRFDEGKTAFLQRLPWHKPLEAWNRRDARFIPVRSGLSRHLVRFLRSGRFAFAVKETSEESARREYTTYRRLLSLSIPTLLPAGYVIRREGLSPVATNVGVQAESQSTGYIVTQLLEFSLPNYILFQRRFRKENRNRIWDAIIRLFINLHQKNVYWGDASLSNMMIVFAKERFPAIGVRTILRAVLADAETIEFVPQLSSAMRMADVDHFLESMAWAEEDLRRAGASADELMTAEDQHYIRERYCDLFEAEREAERFKLITSIDVDKLLGTFQSSGQSRALLQHIYEHKWYLSERGHREIGIDVAAQDWYKNVFKPVMKLFGEFDILDDFPESTAASLYLDIMLHKYYLSEETGRDVGLIAAFEDYASTRHRAGKPVEKLLRLMKSLRTLFPR